MNRALIDVGQCEFDYLGYDVILIISRSVSVMPMSLLTRLPLPPLPDGAAIKLARLLSRPLQLLPFALQRAVISRVVQQVCQEAIDDGDLDFLQGRCLRVRIDDLNLEWSFGFNRDHISLVRYQPADVTISGKLQEFLLLATRREDPDTLFFQRRLMIEGDTDLGHGVKNTLDSIELEQLPFLLRQGLQHLATRL